MRKIVVTSFPRSRWLLTVVVSLFVVTTAFASRRDSGVVSIDSILDGVEADTLSLEVIAAEEDTLVVESEVPKEKKQKKRETVSTEIDNGQLDAKTNLERMQEKNLETAKENAADILESEVTSLVHQDKLDSVFLKNGDIIVGEIQKMEEGVLEIETAYSDDDFRIEWYGIAGFETSNSFLITTNDGRRLQGSLRRGEDGTILVGNGVDNKPFTHQEIVELIIFDDRFIDRVSIQVDAGYIYKLAGHEHQFNGYLFLGYDAPRWRVTTSYTGTQSIRDSVDATKRHEWDLNYRYFLPKDWFLDVTQTFLKSTEFSLALRSTSQAGGGYYIIHSNRGFWDVGLGLAVVHEIFDIDTLESITDLQGYISTEFNIFPIGDLDLLFKVVTYPSFSDWGRWRIDGNFDVKYDFPRDFYIKAGIILNFDNRPSVDDVQLDYVITTGVGWEL